MRHPVTDTGLPRLDAPLEWGVTADGTLYTSQIPIRSDGTVETGDVATQAALTLDNLKRTVEAAGGTMADVTQVQVFLVRSEDFAAVNHVYASYFDAPYPSRATVVVAELLVPGMAVEMIAFARVPSP